MTAIHVRVGRNLQRMRKRRGLSLEKLAEVTGVSKGMLHQIERGDAQPTVTTIWKIATGLNISFSSLLEEDEAAVSVVTPKAIPDATEDNGKCRVYVLFPFDPQTRFEIFMIALEPSGSYTSSPHNDGVQEFITVVSGVFQLQIGDQRYTLPKEHSIRFAGNVYHTYSNLSHEDVVLHIVMYYSEP